MTDTIYVRRCQECGKESIYKDPATYKDKSNKESWRLIKCRKCKSESLDYGSYKPTNYRLKIGW